MSRRGNAMRDEDASLGELCRSCGLCCDGSLFGRVSLEPDEPATARTHGLHVLRDDRAFEQPCAALARRGPSSALRECTLYEERPRACRRFVCTLYERHRREGGPLEARLARVRRVRELLESLAASGLTADDFEGAREAVRALGADGERYEREYAELVVMIEDFARAVPAE
jgi:Fe-S-cluster containining protein